MTFNFEMVEWDEDSIPKGAYISKEVTNKYRHSQYWAIEINTIEELVALMAEVGDKLILSKADRLDGDFENTVTVYNYYIE